MSSSAYLFVYGTLLSSQHRNRFSRYLTRNADLVGCACIRGRLYGLKRYPGLRPPQELSDLVHGEVYRLKRPANTWRMLDEYEGSDYRRVRRQVIVEDADSLRCWVYLHKRSLPRHRRIDSGMWENRNS